MKTPPNIVLNSTTQLATDDFSVVEANISKSVSSGSSSPTSSFMNISLNVEHLPLRSSMQFSDFTLVKQPYILYLSSTRRFHDVFVARFPSANSWYYAKKIFKGCSGLYPTRERRGFYATIDNPFSHLEISLHRISSWKWNE